VNSGITSQTDSFSENRSFIRSFVADVLNEDWIKNRMVRSHRLLSLVLVAIGFRRRLLGAMCVTENAINDCVHAPVTGSASAFACPCAS
jgi:hypothetical protein